MERFIHRENIANFLDQLRREVEPVKRRTLLALFAEEMRKFAGRPENLEICDRQLSDCKLRIARQREQLDGSQGDGHDGGDARRLLDNLVEIEALLVECRAAAVVELGRSRI